jgi:hypothetical protein
MDGQFYATNISRRCRWFIRKLAEVRKVSHFAKGETFLTTG